MQQKHREASVQVRETWAVVEEMDFPRLAKLTLPNVEEPEDLYVLNLFVPVIVISDSARQRSILALAH